MGNKIIAATLQVDTGSSNPNIKEVNKNLKDVATSLTDAGKSAKGASGEVDGAGSSFSKLRDKISSVPGPLGQAGEGVGKLNSAFKALLANPIVAVLAAIVAVLALIYKAFTNTFEGGQKVEQIFSGIKAAAQSLLDNLDKIGNAIVKVFKFDFSGAVAEIKGVQKAAIDAYNTMADLTKKEQELHREGLANDLDQAKRQKELAILREQASDDSVPIAERKKALEQLKADAEQNSKDDIDLAKRTTENKIAQLTLQKDGEKKNQDEITALRIKQIQVETDNANELRRINKQITAVDRQEESERKQIAKDAEDRRKESARLAKQHAEEQKKLDEQRQKNIEALAKAHKAAQLQEVKDLEDYGKQLAAEQAKLDAAEAARIFNNEQTRLSNKKKLAELDSLDNPTDPEAKIKLIQAQLDLENSVLDANDIQRQINAKKASDAIVEIKKEEVDAKAQLAQIEQQNEQLKAAVVADALEALSEVAGKQTALGKALSIASTTINTYESAIASFRGVVSTIPGPVGIVLGAVAAAAAVAQGIAAVKKIVAVKIPGQGGGGSAPTGGLPVPAAPVAPTQQSTQLDPNSINGIGSAVGNSRAYVLDADIADHRERSERLSRAARLGG